MKEEESENFLITNNYDESEQDRKCGWTPSAKLRKNLAAIPSIVSPLSSREKSCEQV